MDGRTIQEASQRALDLGATPVGVIDAMAELDVAVPLVVMTYYNLVARMGHERCAQHLRAAGVDGAIVPDLPLDELDGWGDAADAAGVETVLLAAPTTPDDRLRAICERSHGFVYGVSLMGVTGERSALAAARRADGRALQGRDRQAGAPRRRDLHARAGRRGRGQRRRRDRRQCPGPAAARRRRPRRGRGLRRHAPRGARRAGRRPNCVTIVLQRRFSGVDISLGERSGSNQGWTGAGRPHWSGGTHGKGSMVGLGLCLAGVFGSAVLHGIQPMFLFMEFGSLIIVVFGSIGATITSFPFAATQNLSKYSRRR